MTEHEAATLARILGGALWQPLPGLLYVVLKREDGALIVLGDGAVRAYADAESLERAEPLNEIELTLYTE